MTDISATPSLPGNCGPPDPVEATIRSRYVRNLQTTAFDSNAPLGARRAIIRRSTANGKLELVELAWGLPNSDPAGRSFRFVRSEGR